MLRDGCGLSQRTAQNLGDGAEYAVDAAMAFFLGGFSRASKAASFAENVINAAARRAMGRVEVRLREPPPASGERGVERNRDAERMARDRNRFAERGEARVTRDVQRDSALGRQYRRDISGRGNRFFSDPEMRARFQRRVDRADVDHRLDLQLGGQDTRSNLILRESGVNRSFGRQIQHQIQNLPEGTRIRRFTLERPPQGE
jgi:hypothetical protein